jgi:hypothetical protein
MKPIHASLAILSVLILLVAGCTFVNQVDCEKGIVGEDSEDTEERTLEPITGGATTEEPEKERDGLPVKTVTEGDLVEFPNLKAVDPDGDKITYTFTEPLDENGEWQTEKGDGGEYKVVITASDGTATSKQEVIIKVLASNVPPTLELEDVAVREGDQVVLAPKVDDADGDELTVTYSGWMDSNTKETTSSDAGEHEVTVTVSDGEFEVEETITVTVSDVNLPPQIGAMQDFALVEGDKIELMPNVVDPDGDEVEITYSEPFDEMGVWETGRGDEGVYPVTITATDSAGLSNSIKFIVAVEVASFAPKITGPATISIEEGDTIDLSEHISITDPDSEEIEVTITGWMDSYVKETDSTDAGEYKVTITATDGLSDPVSASITIVVGDVNQAPVFAAGSFD